MNNVIELNSRRKAKTAPVCLSIYDVELDAWMVDAIADYAAQKNIDFYAAWESLIDAGLRQYQSRLDEAT